MSTTHEMRCMNDLCPGLALPAGYDEPRALHGLLRFIHEHPDVRRQLLDAYDRDHPYRVAHHLALQLLLPDAIEDTWRVHYTAEYWPPTGPSYSSGGEPGELDDPGCPECREPGVDQGPAGE